ncbi:hypothetical protein JCM8547_006846 [Rhodosporidiobolus lusitaniae]
MLARTSIAVGILIATCLPLVSAYIPAVPTNETSALDGSDDLLHLAYSAGVYNAKISRQLWQESFDDYGDYTNVSAVVPWTKYNKGVLIHFDESLRSQPPASVPWIAMISCDTNGTSYSENDDIFTICRDLGAEAALLYSLHSEGCQITQEYLTTYEKVLDVFATTTLQASRIIEQQFVNVNSAAYAYSSETLNASSAIIDTLLNSNALSVSGNVPINATSSDSMTPVSTESMAPTAIPAETSPSVFDPDNDDDSSSDGGASTTTMPSLFSGYALPPRFAKRQATSMFSTSSLSLSTSSAIGSGTRTSVVASATTRSTTNYLGAVMAASNLTVGGLLSATPSASSTSSSGGGGGSNSQSLAMIILYAITAVVVALFCVVILSGAIRAIRHPERYGPRVAGARGGEEGGGGGAQTRAGGLTRAILDTFPVVRFGQGQGNEGQNGRGRDEEEGRGGDEGAETPKKGGEVGGEEVELAVLPPIGRGGGRKLEDEVDVEEVVADESGGRGRSDSRASVGGESFHSAQSTPLNHRTSVASLGGATNRALSPLSHAALPSSSPTATNALQPPPVLTTQASSSSTAPLLPPSAPSPPSPSSSTFPPSSAVGAPPATGPPTGDDEADSCPICFTEFEAGDELRVLPCDQRHIFHTTCIDPWLLEVSSSCPLCRLDLAHVNEPPTSPAPLASADDPERHAETEARQEEERVIRHLRALLHRGSSSGVAPPPPPAAGGSGGGAGGEEAARTARLRGRFARYVAARRGRGAGGAGEAPPAAGSSTSGGGVLGRRRRSTTLGEAEGVLPS